ncbi:short chain dehydrogenase reductase [Aaosphaeria arxii CBS 175.79]|uniref:Short chain dehydrogenase reductase n=1 Tax=Aaosphaeria arxii CBS 175.79 TaxID=1450172 RepID=A0A6A5Y692_9PLEO|nr:short chain dehydrogenase reductase [Aaosphaeria arxii CBS 175.79]KAF2020074.1 short chain dehydrogenase reductase [Aaosphaeria arxii CBS 175.79]
MSVPIYHDGGVVDTTSPLNLASLAGKSVIVTGGANGLGRAYTEAFMKSGAFVTIADVDEKAGERIASEHSGKAQFVRCDVHVWEDQVSVFEAAVKNSPNQSCDIVIANAGIVGTDDLYSQEDPTQPPIRPNLRILEINLIGMVYTTKLAMHYFRRQPQSSSRDRCLILKGSIAAYADQPGSPQYNASKWGARGLMRNLRRTAWRDGIRVNFVAPWYVRTPILSDVVVDFLQDKGVKFATIEDCANTMLRIASVKGTNGRAFGVVPKEECPSGCMDLRHDDYETGDFLKGWQEIVLDTAQSIVDLA